MPELKRTSLDIDRELWRQVRIRAATEDLGLAELVDKALRAYLATAPSGGTRKAKKGGKK